MKKEKSNLTLIIPTRWRSKLLAQSIDSAINNGTFENEIIIIADFPTWQTLQVIQERKLIHYTTHFAHYQMCCNFGIWKAHTDYVGICNDDVYFGPKWDEALLDIMRPKVKGGIAKYENTWGIGDERYWCGFDGKDYTTFKPELLDKAIAENCHRAPVSDLSMPVTHHRKTFFKYYGYTVHKEQAHGHERQFQARMSKADNDSESIVTWKSGLYHYGTGGAYVDPGMYYPSTIELAQEGFCWGLRLCLGCGKAEHERYHPRNKNYPGSLEAKEVDERGYFLCDDCKSSGKKDVGKFYLWNLWPKEPSKEEYSKARESGWH